MAKFCTFCGKPLTEGEVCSCSRPAPSYERTTTSAHYGAPVYDRPAAPVYDRQSAPVSAPRSRPSYASTAAAYNSSPKKAPASSGGIVDGIKNHMGLGEPETGKPNPYEKGKKIVPDCVAPMSGEEPVKQYSVATLRNRILTVPYSKAKGRVQVTNKRVIFRAPGSSLLGRNALQHEFDIQELAGVEAHKENTFRMWDFLFGNYVIGYLGAMVLNAILMWLFSFLYEFMDYDTVRIIMTALNFIFGAGCLVPFFLLKRKWGLKLLLSATAVGQFVSAANSIMWVVDYVNWVFLFLAFVAFAITIFCLIVYSIKPNVVIEIKTKNGTDGVRIRRRTIGTLFGTRAKDTTAYGEIIAGKDYDVFVREINAVIHDIQTMGDGGAAKWKG